MERFLHEGAHAVASVYAPISYAPLPCLAFKLQVPMAVKCGRGACGGQVWAGCLWGPSVGGLPMRVKCGRAAYAGQVWAGCLCGSSV
eukprot:36527-Chlamydomonas_euryale.AAC.1